MSDHTAIQWTDATWNPTRGCSRVSPGCTHCYAERIATRFAGKGQPYENFVTLRTPKRTETGETDGTLHGMTGRVRTGVVGRWNGVMRLVEDKVTDPLRWRKPRRIFVNSMSDLFHENLPDEAIDQVFAVMALCPQHTFQILTKRAERMQRYLALLSDRSGGTLNAAYRLVPPMKRIGKGAPWQAQWPLPNVWLGVSVENQHFADKRIPLLLQTSAAVRFISAEPLLEHIDLAPWLSVRFSCESRRHPQSCGCGRLDWIICGGESGPQARPFSPAWARSIIAQCRAAGVACFYKQGGAANRCQHDSKGGCYECLAPDLRVREYPDAARS